MRLPGDDDPIIREYLLGRLPEKEAERLDELSIADDEFALRLTAVENDLVDAYVRGDLPSESRDRFRSFYLASPKRREKVRFAEALLAHERRATAAQTVPARSQAGEARDSILKERRRGFFQLIPVWGFAAAVLLLATVLLIQNHRLSMQIRQLEAERARLVQSQQALEKQLQEQRATVAETTAGQSATGLPPSKALATSVPAFVLSPALRGTAEIASIAAPASAKQINVRLQLEANDFSGYRVTLKNPATDRAIWRSGEIKLVGVNRGKAVSVLISTSLLKQQNYSFELSGIRNHGASELISSYPFRFIVSGSR